jgi:hypothetical protein
MAVGDTDPAQPDTRGYGPKNLDENTPNAARMYDYVLGGAHNFAVDRELIDTIFQRAPSMGEGAKANRAFLQRAVRFLVSQGIDQFLDLGSGVPTVGNVHEIVQAANPDAKVVYVDYEPVAYHAARDLLTGNSSATIIQADVREPDVILDHPQARALLDFTRPIGLIMAAVLHFIPDRDRPGDLVSRYKAALAPGSQLAISHTSIDEAPDDIRAEVARLQDGFTSATEQFHMRGRDEIASWFSGTDLVPPGLVAMCDWRPDGPVTDEQQRINYSYAGVGRVPA